MIEYHLFLLLVILHIGSRLRQLLNLVSSFCYLHWA